MAKVFLRKKISDRIQKGHNWIFQNEIGDIEGAAVSGDLVSVHSSNGSFIGNGQYNKFASIAIRLLSRDNGCAINEEWLFQRIVIAKKVRQSVSQRHNYYRLVNDEIDGLGGLFIDVYDRHVNVIIITSFWDRRKDWIQNALVRLGFDEGCIHFDISHKLRKVEGLEVSTSEVPLEFTQIVGDNTLSIHHFNDWPLDRRAVREWLATHANDRVVWDLFSGSGNFALQCLVHGAKKVYAVDQQEETIMLKTLHIFHQFQYIQANVFDWIRNPKLDAPDIILLDCPIFNASQSSTLQPYHFLIQEALSKVNNYGCVLLGKSSAKMNESIMNELLQDIYHKSKCSIRLVQKIGLPEDFGLHPQYPHLNYLEFYVIQKIDKQS